MAGKCRLCGDVIDGRGIVSHLKTVHEMDVNEIFALLFRICNELDDRMSNIEKSVDNARFFLGLDSLV